MTTTHRSLATDQQDLRRIILLIDHADIGDMKCMRIKPFRESEEGLFFFGSGIMPAVHGDADKLIPPAMMEELYLSCNSKKDKLIIQGAGHADSMKTEGEKYWSTVFAFLANAGL